MSRRTHVTSLAVLLTWTGLAAAQQQPTVLDLIPADAVGALAIRNLEGLKTRGDKLIADAKLPDVPRPSELFAKVSETLNAPGALDMAGSAALILARPDRGAEVGDLFSRPSLEYLVVALPVGDREKLTGAFGLTPGQLRPGKVIAGSLKDEKLFLSPRAKHLYVSQNTKALARVTGAKNTLRDELPGGHRKALEEADLCAFYNPGARPREWREKLDDVEHSLERWVTGDAAAANRLIQPLRELRFVVGAARIEDGLGLTLVSVFSQKGAPAAHKLLTDLRGGGKGTANLKGLPTGPAVFALAARDQGERTEPMARALFGILLRDFVEGQGVLSASNRPVYTEVLGAVWHRVKGSRTALYQSRDERKNGLFSLVAILDTQDGASFLADMRALSRIGLEREAKAGGKEAGPDIAGPDIAQLVRDLSDPKYRVRASATLKLRLIGEPALPYLKKAMASGDLETSRRAEQLWEQIRNAAAELRKEMLTKGLPGHLRPSLAFASRAEERAGHRVEVVRIQLRDPKVPASKEPDSITLPDFVRGRIGGAHLGKALRAFLGPEWDRMRLAAAGNHVVVLLGSETELLDRTLDNLKDGKPGLAGAKSIAAFARQAGPGRNIELHVSAQRVAALMREPDQEGPAPPRAGAGLTSFGISVGADDLRFDLLLPLDELQLIGPRIR
jgi:hypothetical protein